VLILKNSLVPALSQSITTKNHFASIHSTPITCDKRKSKRDGVSVNFFSFLLLCFYAIKFRFFNEWWEFFCVFL
jgi:hypothetical protein